MKNCNITSSVCYENNVCDEFNEIFNLKQICELSKYSHCHISSSCIFNVAYAYQQYTHNSCSLNAHLIKLILTEESKDNYCKYVKIKSFSCLTMIACVV